MVNLAKTHDTLNVVNDQLGNPTNAVDLAYHILKLAVSHDYGIYHCTGGGIAGWYDFASEIIRLSGLPCTVKPVTAHMHKRDEPPNPQTARHGAHWKTAPCGAVSAMTCATGKMQFRTFSIIGMVNK